MNEDFFIDYRPLLAALEANPHLEAWAGQLPELIAEQLSAARWGDLPGWRDALENLPDIQPEKVELEHSLTIGSAGDCSPDIQAQLRQQLMVLHPWRKGPIDLFGIHIDTEWRSDWKWQRVLPQIAPLKNRTVLDVGCGNGYHCLRMLGQGASRVIGIDPSPRFVMQFYALKKYLGDIAADVLPLGIEAMPAKLGAFDTVFSMGVLYHRRSPMDHLRELLELLRPGGQLVLETLIIEAESGQVLVPEGRYAKMPNVWFIPSPDTLLGWLKKCGLKNPRVVDVCPTTADEQRSTEWMRFDSLDSFLDPGDHSRTIEGHPAPVRAVFIAEAP